MAHVEVGVEIMIPPAKPEVEVLLATYYGERFPDLDGVAIVWQTCHGVDCRKGVCRADRSRGSGRRPQITDFEFSRMRRMSSAWCFAPSPFGIAAGSL